MRFFSLLLCWTFLDCSIAVAEDFQIQATFRNERQEELTQNGRVLTRALDGGLLFQTPDSRLWTITPQQLISEKPTAESFHFWNADELSQRLRTEFGPGFVVTTRDSYLFCSDADKVFVDSVARVMIRLHKAFEKFWTEKKFPLHTPEHPLVVLIFKRQEEYAQYATREFGPEIAQAPGYFSMIQNRVVFYDVTVGLKFSPQTTMEERLEKSGRQVSTIVHEATHQLAFNIGLQTRLADNPLWLTEGLAMYFETPDLKSRTGWTTAGRMNTYRLQTYRKLRDGAFSWRDFVSNDEPFRNPRQEQGAYARAWGLTYYLLTKHPDQFVDYLRTISAKKRLIWNTPEERREEFEAAFGPADKLQAAMEKFYAR